MAKVTLRDNATAFVFDLPPESFKVDLSSDASTNQVLDTNNPVAHVKSVSVVYTLTRMLFMTNRLVGSQASTIKELKSLVLSRRLLRFTYGAESDYVYVASMSYSIKGWTNSEPSWIEVDMTLKAARETASVTSTSRTTSTKKLSTAQAAKYEKSIAQLLQIPANQLRFNTNANTRVEVGLNQVVTLTTDNTAIQYPLSDFGL